MTIEKPCLLMLLLVVAGLASADDAGTTVALSATASRVIATYEAQIAKLHAVYLAARLVELDKAEAALKKEVEIAARKGDLDQALAIKAKIDSIAKAFSALSGPVAETTSNVPSAIAGTWHVVKPDGTDATWTFTADGRASGPNYYGKWDVRHGAIYITWNLGETYWDSFPLPICDIMDGDGHQVPKGSVHAVRISH